ncbi:hypothetical protein GWO43_06445 [candidate division KSB1 bacterium]|nr:hypothetical protein [candidate division KSB1 bacterium]NIS23601.1 hypothetical protein [candidate division KSB1 bacterium]NIT70527.1 hypothetical protein [candidate division KSB1 bacterium]NIU24260.1 hypothetical protein [candidate division KSB1 bacterium]NIU93787.1 hypothetical protein [candidate division KSB1 bacterium]
MENNELEENELSPADIFQITLDVREQAAEPDDARKLLQIFCELQELWTGNGLDKDNYRKFEFILQHFRDSFQSYLNGDRKTLEAALGLKRKKARPKADPQIRTEMAAEVLRLRLKQISHQDALEEVSHKFGWGITVIGEAWAAHKQDALILLRLERALDSYPWSPDEFERLKVILGKEPWFLTSEKSRTKPV